jgi:hypothetical protein
MRYFFSFFIILFFVGCIPRPIEIEDVRKYNQNFEEYAKVVDNTTIDNEYFKKHLKDATYYHIRPWILKKLSHTKKDALWAYRVYTKSKKLYGHNHKPLPKGWFDNLVANSNLDRYNQDIAKAITINNSALRNFPTKHPYFYSFESAGEGYPFDYNQNSGIKANIPLIISHYSKDRAYAFVQSPFALGWINSSDIALVDEEFISEYRKLPKAVAIKDNFAVSDSNQNFLYYAKLATIFVKKSDNIQIIKKDDNNYAYLKEANIDTNNIASYPIEFNSTNVKNIANELIEEFYGWGELLDTRDCSALTRDYFRPFGIWLPRNSAGQKSKGKYTKISHLSPREKEAKIIKEAIPFRSTIYLKGHIMLYIGHYRDKVLVFHNTWGIKTIRFMDFGRKVVGKAVVTTLYAGDELPDVAKDKILIHRIKGFTNH